MKAKKYLFIGVPSRFGSIMKSADNLQGLKLSKYDKEDVRTGKALLLTSREDKVVRIYSNGMSMG
jgi:hypothetical protein